MRKTTTKSNLRKKVVLPHRLQFFRKGSQGRTPEAETEAEALEEFCLWVCCPWLALHAFLKETSELSLLIAVINQVIALHSCAEPNPREAFPQ